MKATQSLGHSDQNGSEHAFQTPAGHSREGTARCTSDTPSSDFQHVLQICSDHSWEGTLTHRGDTSCEHQSF